MVLLELLTVKVKVIDVSTWGTTRFPLVWQWCLQTFLRNVEEITILLHVHSEVLCILFDLLYCGVIFFIEFLLHYLETFTKQCLCLLNLWIYCLCLCARAFLLLLMQCHHLLILKLVVLVELIIIVLVIVGTSSPSTHHVCILLLLLILLILLLLLSLFVLVVSVHMLYEIIF